LDELNIQKGSSLSRKIQEISENGVVSISRSGFYSATPSAQLMVVPILEPPLGPPLDIDRQEGVIDMSNW
jgi:hypothetical protein